MVVGIPLLERTNRSARRLRNRRFAQDAGATIGAHRDKEKAGP
ncbi:hypothetical protein [Sphingomonas sp. VNH70]